MPKESSKIAVAPESRAQREEAEDLTGRLGIPSGKIGTGDYALLLVVTGNGLELRRTGPGAPGPVKVDFTSGRVDYRRRHSGGRKETVVRAVGIRGKNRPTVLDATAGLGRDAFVLACQGCKVEMLERNPIIAALLEDGLRRASADAEIGEIVRERMTLHRGDSLIELANLPPDHRPDVIYLDPMYPHRGKSALVKKEMRVIRILVGDDEDSDKLLPAALRVAIKRVVVKRPAAAPPLAGPKPDLDFRTKSHRFDVYYVRNTQDVGKTL